MSFIRGGEVKHIAKRKCEGGRVVSGHTIDGDIEWCCDCGYTASYDKKAGIWRHGIFVRYLNGS